MKDRLLLRWTLAITGFLPVCGIGLVFALGAGPETLGIVIAIWFSGFVCGSLYTHVDSVDPLLARERDSIDLVKRALAQRDEALDELHRVRSGDE